MLPLSSAIGIEGAAFYITPFDAYTQARRQRSRRRPRLDPVGRARCSLRAPESHQHRGYDPRHEEHGRFAAATRTSG